MQRFSGSKTRNLPDLIFVVAVIAATSYMDSLPNKRIELLHHKLCPQMLGYMVCDKIFLTNAVKPWSYDSDSN